MTRCLLCLVAAARLLLGADTVPKFEDFPVTTRWSGSNAPVRLVTRDERMYRTRLTEGAREKPDFADHYKFVGWGCGSWCGAGALIDLQTGIVYPPPRSLPGQGTGPGMFASGQASIDFKLDSRLFVVRQMAQDPDFEEIIYYEWTGSGFRSLTKRIEKRKD
ncbi:MAG: hypothetical protein NTZ56_14065 [Acidobacteria bacterium]|nr:hypothetical protein [Acidobacteriota bacterium]